MISPLSGCHNSLLVSLSYPSECYGKTSSVDQYPTVVCTSDRGKAASSGPPTREAQGRVCQKFCVNAMEHHTLHKNAEGGKRKGLVFKVFLCTCCVPFSPLLFVDV